MSENVNAASRRPFYICRPDTPDASVEAFIAYRTGKSERARSIAPAALGMVAIGTVGYDNGWSWCVADPDLTHEEIGNRLRLFGPLEDGGPRTSIETQIRLGADAVERIWGADAVDLTLDQELADQVSLVS